ncbi:glycosyltransferase family 4 protein [Streptomyces sp. HC44]|uniref:Glycosyltransferase family 4 protein n=1 Tax=Streptomyces scabichelini TaxID=2711217 RepID=A0A6G4UX90_9ACTN|nr:glycosyltransferase family 4 protein [Streptomyces scabichelini]NGO06253.1 glycosyltransferase family 4 protein [Streptomyces scabichelini]
MDGRAVEADNAKALTEALLELINNHALRHQMAHTALKDSERFGPTRAAERQESITAAQQAADLLNTMVRWETP